MSDLARWELRGPVRTFVTQCSEWNIEAGDWWPLKIRYTATVRADGKLTEIEHHNPDGSVLREVRIYDEAGRLTEDQLWSRDVLTRRVIHSYDIEDRPASSVAVDADGTKHEVELCRYDEQGRKTKVIFLPVPESSGASCSTDSCGTMTMYGVEGSEVAYSAPGATTSTTTFDEHGRPSEVTFHDANEALVSRVVFSRDQDGRVLSERMEFAGPGGLPGLAIDASMPADERTSLMALLESVFEDHVFSLSTYAYDEKGHRVESIRRMGKLSEERVTVRYDDFDNPVEEVRVDVSRPSPPQHVRFEYRYDAHGNWTERIVWPRMAPDADERPSNIERRTIVYYG